MSLASSSTRDSRVVSLVTPCGRFLMKLKARVGNSGDTKESKGDFVKVYNLKKNPRSFFQTPLKATQPKHVNYYLTTAEQWSVGESLSWLTSPSTSRLIYMSHSHNYKNA